MRKLGLAILFLVPSLGLHAQSDITILSMKRVFEGNGEWKISTNKGTGTLKSTFSDGSEWRLEMSGVGVYTIKQTFKGDKSEWVLKDGGKEMFLALSFKGDYNEWRSGEEKDFLYTKTVYKNNFAEWEAENLKGKLQVKSVFSNGSEWRIVDKSKEKPIVKFASLFSILVSSVLNR